jgi:hypothetical protein
MTIFQKKKVYASNLLDNPGFFAIFVISLKTVRERLSFSGGKSKSWKILFYPDLLFQQIV